MVNAKQRNKAHKAGRRAGPAGARKQHKLPRRGETGAAHALGVRKGGGAAVGKGARKEAARRLKEQKKGALAAERQRAGGATRAAPRVVCALPLGVAAAAGVDALAQLAAACEAHAQGPNVGGMVAERDAGAPASAPALALDAATVSSARLRARFTLLSPDPTDVLAVLDAASVADVVLLVVDAPGASELSHKTGAAAAENVCVVSEAVRPALRALCAQGVPALAVALRGLAALPPTQRNTSKKAALAALARDAVLGEPDKAFPADTAADWQLAARALSELRPRPPAWRCGGRAYVLAHRVGFEAGATAVAEGADAPPADAAVGTLVLEGYVRGADMHAGQLVHVQGAGDFAVTSVDAADEPEGAAGAAQRKSGGDVAMGGGAGAGGGTCGGDRVLSVPSSSNRHLLMVENEYDELQNEQTWPTAEELEAADREAAARSQGRRRVPKGTSSYQAPWLLYEEGDEEGGADGMDDHMGGMEEDGVESEPEELVSEPEDDGVGAGGGGDADGMVTDGELRESAERVAAAHAARAAELAERRALAEAGEAEYPDEVDAPLDRPARHRFQKYRGLRSMRTGEWDPKEMLPLEYGRIFSFRSFAQARARAQKEAAALIDGEPSAAEQQEDGDSMTDVAAAGAAGAHVSPGTFVRIRVANVPASAAQALVEAVCGGAEGVAAVQAGALAPARECLVCVALLNHETKVSVAHFRVTKARGCSYPLASKQVLYVRCGFRRFVTRPIFSDDGLRSDKHRYLRFLPQHGTAVATCYMPISFPSVPVLAFAPRDAAAAAAASQAVAAGGVAAAPPCLTTGARAGAASGDIQLALSGSLIRCDPDRIILKRIILTGYPLKVHKRKAVIRSMFHNPDDVRWFRPLELWTKHGRRGRITEPVGTHGAMKCLFDIPIMQHDTVCASLYKRMYPRFPDEWRHLM